MEDYDKPYVSIYVRNKHDAVARVETLSTGSVSLYVKTTTLAIAFWSPAEARALAKQLLDAAAEAETLFTGIDQ